MGGADSDEEEDFNSYNFFRAPIGPPPDLSEPDPPKSKPEAPAPAPFAAAAAAAPAAAPVAAPPATVKPVMINPIARPGFEHLAARPMPVEDMPTEEIKRRLEEFSGSFKKRHGRGIAPSDAKDLPVQILAMYDQIGRRLNPEERAKTEALQEAKAAQAAAAKEEAAAKEARLEAERQKRWAEFEANKTELWKSASSSAKEQRAEAAAEAGMDSTQLSGAASWVKLDDGYKPMASHPTRDEFLQQCIDELGYKFIPDGPTEEERQEEAAAWRRAGGSDADDVAKREEAFSKKTEAAAPPAGA